MCILAPASCPSLAVGDVLHLLLLAHLYFHGLALDLVLCLLDHARVVAHDHVRGHVRADGRDVGRVQSSGGKTLDLLVVMLT